MADCKACEEAAERPRTSGSYYASCISCEARALVRSPQGSQASKEAFLGYPGDLQALMLALWPLAEQYRRGRVEVHRWVRLIDDAKER